MAICHIRRLLVEPRLKNFIELAARDPGSVGGRLRADPSLLDLRDGMGETALHYLVIERERLAVTALLEAGANVNTADDSGDTALCSAVRLGYTDIAAFLLERGADPNMGATAPLHYAIQSRRRDLVDLLIARGADVEARDDLREPALVAAARVDSADIVALLLKNGASVRNVDARGWGPLHAAAMYASESVCRKLIDAGCSLDLVDDDGATPLAVAESCGRNSLAEMLLEASYRKPSS